MYVRWKRRPGAPPSWKRWHNPGGYYEYAVVVRSERVDGKPRQKAVKHLAGYHPSELVPKFQDNEKYAEEGRQRVVRYRRRFWARVGRGLDELAQQRRLTPEQRARIEDRIAAQVPKLTAPEQSESDAASDQARARLAAFGIRV